MRAIQVTQHSERSQGRRRDDDAAAHHHHDGLGCRWTESPITFVGIDGVGRIVLHGHHDNIEGSMEMACNSCMIVVERDDWEL